MRSDHPRYVFFQCESFARMFDERSLTVRRTIVDFKKSKIKAFFGFQMVGMKVLVYHECGTTIRTYWDKSKYIYCRSIHFRTVNDRSERLLNGRWPVIERSSCFWTVVDRSSNVRAKSKQNFHTDKKTPVMVWAHRDDRGPSRTYRTLPDLFLGGLRGSMCSRH